MNTNIKKSFKVIFNSNDKVAGSTNAKAQFYIDWSAILKDNQEYSMSWSYEGQENTFTIDTKIATLNINLFANIYFASGTFINGAINSTNIGVLIQNQGGLYGDINFNTPIHFNSRPTNNNVNIQILNNDSPPTEWVNNDDPILGPNHYILILNFTKL